MAEYTMEAIDLFNADFECNFDPTRRFYVEGGGVWVSGGAHSLQSGGFGGVYVCRHRSSGTLWAVKKVDLNAAVRIRTQEGVYATLPDKVAVLQRETQLMQRLALLEHHPNIVGFGGAYCTPDGIPEYIITEFTVGSVDLHTIVSRDRLNETQAKPIFKQLCQAMNHLHTRTPQIMHRDIKSENIVVYGFGGPTPVVKLIDFGFAKEVMGDEGTLDRGTPVTQAPEVTRQVPGTLRAPYGTKADCYSVGITMFFALKRGYPVAPWAPGGPIPESQFPSSISPGLREIIQRLVLNDVDARWSMQQALEHPWFTTQP